MRDPEERKGDPVSPEQAWNDLKPLLPSIKMLDAALVKIGKGNPERFVFEGTVCRGEKRVYASVENHDPEIFFSKNISEGSPRYFSGFASYSTDIVVMSRGDFCGFAPGPRTILHVQAACREVSSGYCIKDLSSRPDEEEVLCG